MYVPQIKRCVFVLDEIIDTCTTVLVLSQVSRHYPASSETKCRYFDNVFVHVCSGISHILPLVLQPMTKTMLKVFKTVYPNNKFGDVS